MINDKFVDMHGNTVPLTEAADRGFVICDRRIVLPITRHDSHIYQRRHGSLPRGREEWSRHHHASTNPGAPEKESE